MREVIHSVWSEAFLVTSASRRLLALQQCAAHFETAHLFCEEGYEVGQAIVCGLDASAGVLLFERPRDAGVEMSRVVRALSKSGGLYKAFGMRSGQTASDGEGRALWRVPIPSKVYLWQRRSYFRVPTPQAHVSGALVMRADGLQLHAACQDLSVGGVRIAVENAPNGSFHVGAMLAQVSFMLRGQEIDCAASVRYVLAPYHDRKGKSWTVLGLRFERLLPRYEHCVSIYVQESQRVEAHGKSLLCVPQALR